MSILRETQLSPLSKHQKCADRWFQTVQIVWLFLNLDFRQFDHQITKFRNEIISAIQGKLMQLTSALAKNW